MTPDRHGPHDCPACWGGTCHGGGNRDCVQRDPYPSRIAGILDGYGGTRVVVAHHGTFKQHLREGEFLCVVPRKQVHEPIVWGDIPAVVWLGEQAIARWVKAHRNSNDEDKRAAIHAYRARLMWERQRSLDLGAIAFT